MKTKKIYLLRHGETEFNRQGMVQGSGIDASLNATGIKQAAAFYEAYKDTPFDKIYITPLRRTRETVAGFLKRNIPFEVLDGLREISWGTQEGVPFTEETGAVYRNTVKKWTDGELNLKIESGESPVEVMNRQKPAMEYILEKEHEETILICSHGRAMRILLCWLLGNSLADMDQYGHANCGFYVLVYNEKDFEIEVFNEISHLTDIGWIQ